MTDEPLVTVYNFGTPQEAAIAKGFLANHDIPAFVQDGEVATTLFYVGTALGGVKLQVPKSQAERARTLLTDKFNSTGDVPAWRCEKCKNENDAGFEVCWSCGEVYDETITAASETDRAEPEPVTTAPIVFPEDRDDDPYDLSIPRTELKAVAEIAAAEAESHELSGDEIADRAFRAAVFGIPLCPFVFYSFYLILTAFNQPLSLRGRRKLWGAIVITVLVYFGYSLMIIGIRIMNS